MNKRKRIPLTIVLFLLPLFSYSQDVITTTDGADIQARIIKITGKSIKYHPFNEEDTSVTKSILKENVFRISYENGLKEVFNQSHVDDNDQEGHWNKVSMGAQGKQDAKKYYRRYNGAKAGTLITTTVAGAIFGLIPAITASSTPPKEKRLGYPDKALMDNPEYREAYEEEAHRIKRRKVWGSYVGGIIIDVAVVIAIASLR